jgi:hypothetical protein
MTIIEPDTPMNSCAQNSCETVKTEGAVAFTLLNPRAERSRRPSGPASAKAENAHNKARQQCCGIRAQTSKNHSLAAQENVRKIPVKL